MRSEESLRREATSRVFIAKLDSKERARECDRIKRRLWLISHNLSRPYSREELDERYLLIRGMMDCGEIRSGFDIVSDGDGHELVMIFRPTRVRSEAVRIVYCAGIAFG